ncbi:hypothetical protein [Vibrio gangliei]|uniref:hypothetical protein n=1 Tax=Vibrio gangliei TaxID=2077090 RepID=UPI000D01D7BE|nr:hypothetical protein [Vibrio gangliei]
MKGKTISCRPKTWLLTALLTSASPFTWACSYDGLFTNPFAESFPGALDVAIATQEAIQSNQIKMPKRLTGTPGLQRASWWLNLMVKNHPNLPANTYIYLVDTQLWSKYDENKKLTVHANPPENDANIVLVSETALYNITNHNLKLDKAMQLGMVTQTNNATLLSKN